MSTKLRCPNCGGSMKIANKCIDELEAQLETYRSIDKKRFTAMVKLEAQVERYKTALHQVSLSSQNSMSDKAEGGRIARAAIKGEES